ncbi:MULTISPECIES: hypothetical protein [Sphingobacterium]|uniref:hypothetical protein n=1 Tax=Sphingobacterium TaxID=28453 RepID=UPI00259689AD|nr:MULTISPECIES: hypothetical protein [Sphingobacterium]
MKNTEEKPTRTVKTEEKTLKCGIIMPIAPHPDYPQSHWVDVRNILEETIEETSFEICLVWDDPATGLIHERIVTNIYNSDIVICDVSSKNPNVMFELGLRLAFDKPTIIIKDEKTGYSFDTGVIDHLPYPSSLRFSEINTFKQKLREKLEATYEKSKKEKNYSPFLKQFGTKIVPATIGENEISENKYIIRMIEQLQLQVNNMSIRTAELSPFNRNERDIDLNNYSEEVSNIINEEIIKFTSEKGLILNTARDIAEISQRIFNKTNKRISTTFIRSRAIELGVWGNAILGDRTIVQS